jgi:L-amino acid N-acyltransferase YncA
MSARTIRVARAEDRAAIDAIYAHYVRTSTCTYAEQPDSDDERRAWFESHGPSHPVTVIEERGVVLGWASLSPGKTRSGYRHSVELSVYLRPESCGQGLGRELLADLVARAEALGHHAILGGVSADQAASLRLHESMGFTRVAHFRETGFKFGRWLDVVYFERLLGAARGALP